MTTVTGFTPVALSVVSPECVQARRLGYELSLAHDPVERTVTVQLDRASPRCGGHVEASVVYSGSDGAWPAVHDAAVKALEKVA